MLKKKIREMLELTKLPFNVKDAFAEIAEKCTPAERKELEDDLAFLINANGEAVSHLPVARDSDMNRGGT